MTSRLMHHRLLTASLCLMAFHGGVRGADTGIPAERSFTNGLGMQFVRIEPGTFMMGQDGPAADYRMVKHPAKFDDADWDEKPAHKVTLTKDFHIGFTEVTLGQYRAFRPEHGGGRGQPDDAVTGVSWLDAVAFCEWMGQKDGRAYRLPTEAEWEYACRAGTTTLFHTGDALPPAFHSWYRDTAARDRYFPDKVLPVEYAPVSAKRGVKVAQRAANAWGLHDMHGNVAEWCLDWYGPYEDGEFTDPLGRASGEFRVIRGGSHSVFTRFLRSANRAAWLPETAHDKLGFRVVMAPAPEGKTMHSPEPSLYAREVRQLDAKVEKAPTQVPHFSGPKPFVIIPPDSLGPLFSAHNHSPAIAECPNGDLLAVWYSCADEGGAELNNVASRLRLGATEWDPASSFWDGMDVNDHGPKLWWDGARTLYHFVRGHRENIIRTSTDNGVTWSQPILTQPVCEWGNAPIRTREGHLLITTDTGSTSMNISRDGGKSWTFPEIQDRAHQVRTGSGFRHVGIHAGIVQLKDGSLMAAGRQDDPEHQAKFEGKTPVSFTHDGGKTWTYGTIDFPAISAVQRSVLFRLREGPLLFCSFTDQWRDWKNRKGLKFKSTSGDEFTGFGLFAALSYDEGKTWPVKRLVTPGGETRMVNGIDRNLFELSDSMAEPCGYLAVTQTRDDRIQLVTSKNHYVFNLAWLEGLPDVVGK